jgi:hypothetical protein
MSRKGDCWDNAAMESFFRVLKMECVYQERYQTREEAKIYVLDFIEVFYNRQRKHSYHGYKSPEQYEMLACGFYRCVSTKSRADQTSYFFDLELQFRNVLFAGPCYELITF